MSMDTGATRRTFLKSTAMAAAYGLTARSYAAVRGANERVRVGIVGLSDRFRDALLPSFLDHAKELNFDIVALSDLWRLRREAGKEQLEKAAGHPIAVYRNNEEMYEKQKDLDAVIISTADFQHALHAAEAANAGMDAYVEKPLAEAMDDARAAVEAVRKNKRIVQIGSQRRSTPNYHAAAQYIQSGAFGQLVSVDLVWNVNQPDRWRRQGEVKRLKEEDIDWKRYLMNRPADAFDPRKYLEFRLFWPYSSGIPGQWMSHQIDTVHWFTKLPYPRSVAVNGGLYMWKDGRSNADTMTAVFDYGPLEDKTQGFQVVFSSRMNNGAGGTKEVYYSNGGMLDPGSGQVTSDGGRDGNRLEKKRLAPPVEVATSAKTGKDPMTSAHMRNWMECVRSRAEPNAPVEVGYNHSIAVIMTNAAYRTGEKAVYDAAKKEVVAGGRVFRY